MNPANTNFYRGWEFYGCVRCQNHHYDGTEIYWEHIGFQSKHGIGVVPWSAIPLAVRMAIRPVARSLNDSERLALAELAHASKPITKSRSATLADFESLRQCGYARVMPKSTWLRRKTWAFRITPFGRKAWNSRQRSP